MTGVPGVSVLVDGTPLPDGCLIGATGPSVLSGLAVRWGRDNSIDQPAPALCTFDALGDVAGTIPGRLYVGADLIVNADAVTWSGPTVDTIAAPLHPDYGNATGVVATRRITVDPVDPARSVTVTIPPAAHSTDPAAWDAIPRTQGGQQWLLTLSYAASWPGSVVTVRPVTYTGPQPGVRPAELAPVDVTAGSALFVPPAGVWLGIRVTWYPTGPRWIDLDPATRWDQLDPAVSWRQSAQLVLDNAQLVAPIAGVTRTAQLFRGRITDLVASWSTTYGAPVVAVTATDLLADLANRNVGAQPWPAETLAARWGRISASLTVPVVSSVPASVAAAPITYRDVDNQPAAELYAELGRSVDGQVIVGTHVGSGPTLILDPVRDRPALMVKAKNPTTGVVEIVPAAPTTTGVRLSACDVLLDPVRWSQSTADVATRVAARWFDPAPDPTDPTERTANAADTELEKVLGARRVSVSTQLAQSTAALSLADQLLARLSRRGWTITGIVWELAGDVGPDDAATALTLMDATTRISAPITLTDLPDWSPIPDDRAALYLEGGTFTSQGGRWTLDLSTSSAESTGAADIRWVDLDPTWRWTDLDPDIQWHDLAGVGVAP